MGTKCKLIIGSLLFVFQLGYSQDTNNVFYIVMDKLSTKNTLNYLESRYGFIKAGSYFYFCDAQKNNITATNATEFEVAKKYYASHFPSRPDFATDALKFTEYLNKADSFQMSNHKPTNYHFLFSENDLTIYDYEKLILRRFLIINKLIRENSVKAGVKVIVHLTGQNKESILKFKLKYEGYGYEVQSY